MGLGTCSLPALGALHSISSVLTSIVRTHRRRNGPTGTTGERPPRFTAGSSRCAGRFSAASRPAAPACARCARPLPFAGTRKSTRSSSAAAPRAVASFGSSPGAAPAPTHIGVTTIATTDTIAPIVAATTVTGRTLTTASVITAPGCTSTIVSSPTITAMVHTWRAS